MVELDVLEAGDPAAPTLVLLHGAGTGTGMWDGPRAHFAADHHVLVPRLGEDQTGQEFTVPSSAERIAELIETRGNGSAVVCGLSLGAFVGLQLAADRPDLVRALVLSGGQAYPPRTALMATYALLAVLPSRSVLRPGGRKRELLATYRRLFGWDLRDRLSAVRARTLVLCGTRDRTNLAAARLLAAGIPDATLRLVDGAGHLWIPGQPDTFNEILGAFLAEPDDR